MTDGRIHAEGPPSEIVDAGLVAEVFGLACQVIEDPVSGAPLVIPHSAHRALAPVRT
jgi:iron complex transport system ATP-binding protein